MLIKAKGLKGYSLRSLDGDIGSASEFLFDDRFWAVRQRSQVGIGRVPRQMEVIADCAHFCAHAH